MPMQCDVVFFDVGGTLTWVEPGANEIWARTLAEFGYQVTPEEVVARVGVRGPEVNRSDLIRALRKTGMEAGPPFPSTREEERAYFRRYDIRVLERLGLPVREEVLDAVARRWAEGLQIHLYPETLPTLERLSNRGFRMGVISNANHGLPRRLRGLGLDPYFEVTTYSFAVGVEKPDPRIFHEALRGMKVEPHRAVHVGDNYEADVGGARNVGMTPFLVDRDGVSQADDCVVVRSLKEVPDRLEG